MSKITDEELWELFTGDAELPRCFRDNWSGTVCPSKWGEVEDIRRTVADVPRRQDYDFPNQKKKYRYDCRDYLLRLLWIREVLFGMGNLEEDGLRILFKNAFILSGIEATDQEFQDAFDSLAFAEYVQSKDEDWWRPGMRSGSGWTTVYPLTLIGKKTAEKMVKNPKVKPQESPAVPIESVVPIKSVSTLTEYFVTYYQTFYPGCRKLMDCDGPLVEVQKSKPCFASSCGECEGRGPYCNWDDCHHAPYACNTVNCPESNREMFYRVSIGSLTPEELEAFKELTGIEKYGCFSLLTREEIQGLSTVEKVKHNRAVAQFNEEAFIRRTNPSRDVPF